MLKVVKPFCGRGFNFPEIGSVIQPESEDDRQHLLEIGAVEPYEAKVVDPPKEVKKKKQSASSRAGRRQTKKTRKKSKKKSKS